jgi:FkbM family methyltransferase
MQADLFLKHWYIKLSRYLFKKKYLTVMAGPLKGYQWPTSRSYEYIIGNNEPDEVMQQFCSWFKPGSVFYDVGSNIGFYSFVANRFIVSGKIYAIEPTSFNNRLFKRLLQLNKEKVVNNNFEILEFAISDSEKEVEFSNNEKLAESNTYVENTDIYKGERIKIKCYSIDRLIEMGYAVPNIIKIDVEGAEYDALVGATNTLKKYTPNILLATHDCKVPGIKDKCMRYLEDMGYVLQHTGYHNKSKAGLDDFIAVYKDKLQ